MNIAQFFIIVFVPVVSVTLLVKTYDKQPRIYDEEHQRYKHKH